MPRKKVPMGVQPPKQPRLLPHQLEGLEQLRKQWANSPSGYHMSFPFKVHSGRLVVDLEAHDYVDSEHSIFVADESHFIKGAKDA